jgi:hypothetical protein
MKKNLLCALLILLSISASAATFPSMESGRYRELCEEKWTKKGVINQNMVSFCVNNQTEGYYKAKQIIKKYEKQKWIQEVIDHAIKQWTNKGMRQDLMVATSLEFITDGFEELVLASKKAGFSQAKYNKCHAEWKVLFHMVWSCYQN